MTTHLKYKKKVGRIKLHKNKEVNIMIKDIDEKQFKAGLADLSDKSTSSSDGNNHQLKLTTALTDSLSELSEIKDNLLNY